MTSLVSHRIDCMTYKWQNKCNVFNPCGKVRCGQIHLSWWLYPDISAAECHLYKSGCSASSVLVMLHVFVY